MFGVNIGKSDANGNVFGYMRKKAVNRRLIMKLYLRFRTSDQSVRNRLGVCAKCTMRAEGEWCIRRARARGERLGPFGLIKQTRKAFAVRPLRTRRIFMLRAEN